MTILVTGAAGFIGSHVCLHLLERGGEVIGVDNLNDYYDPQLKHARLARLRARGNFSFLKGDIADPDVLMTASAGRTINKVVHLAAQAGVRYSLENPRSYVRSNISGHLEVLEFCRSQGTIEHLVYASSSSVYGGNNKVPFHEEDRVDHPVSLYAATKRADELMSQAYAHLYGIAQTGLRFFTVYGPWGRPDMAYWMFTKAILEGQPIRVFNNGNLWRDFTYIDDVVLGTVKALDRPPGDAHHQRIYNIGHNKPERIGTFIDLLESLLAKKAIRQYEPMQPGDVEQTFADITRLHDDFGFAPQVSLAEGLKEFINWYRDFAQDGSKQRVFA